MNASPRLDTRPIDERLAAERREQQRQRALTNPAFCRAYLSSVQPLWYDDAVWRACRWMFESDGKRRQHQKAAQ